MSKNLLPVHIELADFPVVDDCLVVGEMLLTRLAEQVGRTPFYVYDRKLVASRIELLRNVLPSDMCLHYAIKANPMPALVQHVAGLVDGLDVASAGEMQIALNTGMPAEQISIAGPGKTFNELTRAVSAGVTVNIESVNEMATIAAIAEEMDVRPTVAVRVNPDYELKSSGMRMGGGAKQFGIDADQVPAVLEELSKLPLDFAGFHIFAGSQNLRSDAIIEAQSQTMELALRLSEFAPAPVRTLNIGGGFGIPYFPGDEPIDLVPIAENLDILLQTARSRLPDTRVILELGRFLVGEAGLYVCRVLDRKVSRGQTFLITDGGLHHHLAASGNFGQVIRKNYPVLVGNKIFGNKRETVSVVGPLCTPLDTLADKLEMARADIGDLIVVFQSGAYGLTASPTAFLGHQPPDEIMI